MPKNNTDLLIDHVLKSKKYRYLYRPTVKRIVEDIIWRFPDDKVEKAIKRKLHQIWGAYLKPLNFDKLLTQIEKGSNDVKEIQNLMLPILALQSSTKERIPILNNFYQKIFAITGKPKSIIEPACGFNALTYFWMGSSITYYGFDVDKEQINFFNSVYKLLKANKAQVMLGDVLDGNLKYADIMLLLKVLPLLEHQVKGCSLDLLKQTRCHYVVVSFPTRSLSGKNKGMVEFYSQFFKNLIRNEHWKVRKLLFTTELVFVIEK